MSTTYIVLALVTAGANAFSATADWLRFQPVLRNMERGRVPGWLLPWLGVAKMAGAVGLLVGFAIPALGTAAAIGLVLFFVLAIGVHFRARFWRMEAAVGFLGLATATLALGLAG